LSKPPPPLQDKVTFDSTVTSKSNDRRAPTAAANPRWALVVAVLGSSMAFLDGTVVNVALPVMQRGLGATVRQVQWIVEAYGLMLASLVLVGGALGDRLGRRSVFSAGVVLFALASAACGAAPDIELLIVARAVQGVGAALLVPGSLALISAAYSAEARGAAIGTWSAASAITGAVGPVAGGLVVSHASWRWLFLFNVPIGALVVALAARKIPETRDPDASPRLDLAGAALATLGLGLVVYALVDSGGGAGASKGIAAGGDPARTLTLLLLGAATLALFVVVEARRTAPMLPLSLFRSRTFAGANLLTFALYAALGAAMFFVPFNLIQVQHYAPAAAGASLLPLVVLIASMSRPAGALAARVGPRPLLFVGPLVAAAGFALLALPATGGVYWTTFFPGVVVLGLGMGLTVAPLTTAVMGAVDPRHAGVASGINNAVARAAGLLAIAGLGLLLVNRFNSVLGGSLTSLSLPGEAMRAVEEQRSRLGGADFAALAPSLRAPLRAAFDGAFVAAFRALMLACGSLGALAALAGLTLIVPARPPAEGGPVG
jgi:EmrB/QacA subfamily drug resistance transporter